MSEQTNPTQFGYKTVAATEKETLVAGVFHSVAAKYDLMNDLMSFGIHRLWKRFTIDCSGVRKGQKVLDLAGGTGDLTAKFSRIVGETGQVVLADINDSMLKVGRDKLRNLGVANNVSYVQANAEALPFPDNHFDVITIGFGLRNVTDKDKALASMFRVLKPGGRLLVLEFSKPASEVIAKLYDLYSFKLLPKMGEIVANDGESYKYLAESIRMHPDQATLTSLTSPLLSYGHSGGKVDTQASFIGALMDKSSDFVSISLSDQTIGISGNVAVVRHTLAGATNDRGTPGNVTIKVLTIWQKDGGQWRLLARQTNTASQG